jgi:DHA1 family bicyclomycin/chloramphenicol resistance-like MFS transporter
MPSADDPPSADPATPHWKGARWSLALLLAAMGMLGPFSVDAYLPAFAAIGADLQATPAQMQQTLSALFLAWAVMNLFHGALADSLGRRPVVLGCFAVFALASVGCALAQTLGQLVFFRTVQGLAIGAGNVVSRAVIRDLFAQANAQRLMSQVAMVHGVAPVIAALIGGWLYALAGWRSIFWLLVALVVALWLAIWRMLPETLQREHAQPLRFSALLLGYRLMLLDPRVVLLALCNALPFCAGFIYVLSAPHFMGEHLGLAPTQFYWLFVMMVSGLIGGAWASGRLAGRMTPKRQIAIGLSVMVAVAACNLLATLLVKSHASWSLFPVAFSTFGWALAMPSLSLLLLDLYPDRRGMASSLQSCAVSACIGLTSGLLVPLVLHSTTLMALAMLGFSLCGGLGWLYIRRRWPSMGQALAT